MFRADSLYGLGLINFGRDMRLYTLPSRSVCWLLGWSIRSLHFEAQAVLNYCSCPTVRDWIAAYPALFVFFFLRYRCILVGSIFLFLFLWSRTRELSLAYFISNTLEPHFVCFFGNEIFPSLFQVPFKINRQNHAKYCYLGLKMLIFIVGESL